MIVFVFLFGDGEYFFDRILLVNFVFVEMKKKVCLNWVVGENSLVV